MLAFSTANLNGGTLSSMAKTPSKSASDDDPSDFEYPTPDWPEFDEPDPSGKPSMTVAERESRNMEIVTARLGRGLSWATISKTFDLSERNCRRIVTTWKNAQPALKTVDPIKEIEDTLYRLEGAAEEFALIAQTTTNDSARVGAIKARVDTIWKRVELMQASGVLPNDLGTLRVEMDIRAVAQRVLLTIEQLDLDPEGAQKLMSAVTGQPVSIDDARALTSGSN